MASVYPASPAVDPRLLALADQCVMCGLCLPHCPTYRIAGIEAESPRGRIALARALASGTLAPSAAALTHLDQCLACLSCPKVCPSQVQYEEILVRSRAATAPLRPAPTRLQRLWRDPVRLTRLARLAARLRTDRWLPRLARWLPPDSHLRRLAAAQPQPPRPLRLPHLRAAPAPRGTVALFRGCVASVYDRDTHAAARYLLTALGYAVVESAPAQCCGALPRHLGDIDAAARHAAATRAALQASGAEVVLVSASGCYGDLKEQVLADGTPRVADIHAFLAADPAFGALRFRPLHARAALHLPCTQVNVVGDTAAIGRLLARIPELTVLPLPEQPRCCGAAGSYFLEHAQIAERLRGEKLDQAAALAPDLLLTTNIGCRLHLGNGLRQRDAATPVRHPLALLAQQLENAAP